MASVFAPCASITPQEFRRVTEVTYLGTVYGTMAALRRMAPLNRGAIIQVGSALAVRSIPLQSAYCGAKHGIRGFTDSIRCELIHDRINVHITIVHPPGMNTTFFSWVKSKLPNKPQPMPPIFQPEIAADAIVWASHHRRREIHLGMPAAMAMWGNKLMPGLFDRYLGRTGYASQQTDQPEQPGRPSNLWETVPGDFRVHGDFDDRAKRGSPELWWVKRKRIIGGIAASCAAGALALVVIRRGRH